MKKILTLVIALILGVTCTMGLVGCKKDGFSGRVKYIDVKLSQESYGVAVSKTDANLLNTVNSVLTNRKTDIEALFDKYINVDEDNPDTNLKVEGVVAY